MFSLAGWLERLKRFWTQRDWPALKKKLWVAAVIGGSVGVLVGGMAFFGFLQEVEAKFLDARFVWRGSARVHKDDAVVIVAIDDQSLERMDVRWPWPRSMYAKAIDHLSAAGARVIAFDLVFSEPSSRELKVQDRILGDAIIRSRAWIVLASKFYLKRTEYGDQTSYVAPIPHIDPGKTHVGFVDMWKDPDGIIRHAALIRTYLNKVYQSFALKVLSRYHRLDDPRVVVGRNHVTYGSLRIPAEPNANLLINFRGGPGSFKTLSFENLLDPEIFDGLKAAGMFKDKIVLIGPTFTEAQDNHPTPFFQLAEGGGVTPGVEIHANILNTILRQDYLYRISGPLIILAGFLLLVLLTVCNMLLKPWQSLVLLAAVLVGYWISALWLFVSHNLILPVFYPVLAMAASYLASMMYRVLIEERRSRQIKHMFSRYVSPKVVDQLVRDPAAALRMGGNKQNVTVLFSDIRGFTTLSEQLAPEEVVKLLNEYFEAMTQVIFAQDGMVDKFIGDAIMAIFGAPVAHPDDPFRAVRAAFNMQKELVRLQGQWAARGQRIFEIGVGINTGEAIIGNMGSTQAMGYTAIGDTVNLASRLESLNKELSTSILISESTYAQVKDRIVATAYPGVHVKGKANNLTVYEVLELRG